MNLFWKFYININMILIKFKYIEIVLKLMKFWNQKNLFWAEGTKDRIQYSYILFIQNF